MSRRKRRDDCPPDNSPVRPRPSCHAGMAWCEVACVVALIAVLTLMRIVYAGVMELRTDEAITGPGRRRARCPSSITRPASPG